MPLFIPNTKTMSKTNKQAPEIAPTTLEEALAVIEANKAEINNLKEANAKLDFELSNAKSNAEEVASLNETLKAKVDKLTKQLERSGDDEKDKLIEELTNTVSLLQGNQDKKSTLVKDVEGNTYKLRTAKITIPGNAAEKTNAKAYTAEELANAPDVVSLLVKIKSGLLVKVN